MAAVNYLNNVPKLMGRENYADWAFAVENVFVLEGLTKCINATETDTDLTTKAKAKLILTLDPSLYIHVKDSKTASDVWNKLKKLYEDSGFARKISLLRKLISLRLENCDSMEDYINRIIDTSQKLERSGFELSQELIGSLMLAGLTDKFEPMVIAIEHAGIDVTADSIKSKLLDMHLTDETSSKVGGALAAKFSMVGNHSNGRMKSHFDSDSNRSQKVNKNKSEVRCFKCNKKGHFKNKCPQNAEKHRNEDSQKAFNAVFLTGNFNSTDWYIDSGCSVHLTSRKEWLENVHSNLRLKEITVANDNKLSVELTGDIVIETLVGNQKNRVKVCDVLYVPKLMTNLLSVSQLIKNGNQVIFKEKGCEVYNNKNQLVAIASLQNNVYKLNFVKPQIGLVACLAFSGDIWHRRFGHLNFKDLNIMRNGLVDGLECTGSLSKSDFDLCEVCCEGKQSRLPFNNKGRRASAVLEVIHGDLCGPMEVTSLGGSKYFMVLEDDFSRMVFIYFLEHKGQVFEKFKEFKAYTENQQGKKIKIFRSDQGTEFSSNEFRNFYKKNGILHQQTNAYTPQQNGMSERMNRTILEKARCLLYDAKLEKFFWAEAVGTAVYLRNRSSVSGLDKTPFEIWHGKKPDVSNIRIFGSKAMALIPKEKRLKWDKKSKRMILVGFSDHIKGYRLYDPEEKKIIVSRDVVIEETMVKSKVPVCEIKESSVSVGADIPKEVESCEADEISSNCSSEHGNQSDDVYLPNVVVDASENVRRSQRVPKPKKLDDYITYLCVDTDLDPITVEEALSRGDGDRWMSAMQEELQSFADNEAWEVVSDSRGKTVVKNKWVFKRKIDHEGNVRYRARLVAKGFTQKAGIDFNETFSPVVRFSTLRLLFALSQKLHLNVCHLDVATAFLNGDLKENVYMQVPQGLEIADSKNKVLKLKKAIYGLKQSSRSWYERVDSSLKNFGYKKSEYEPCLYTKMENNLKTIVCVYVDDFFIFSNDDKETDCLKIRLGEKFKIKDLGEVKNCLGIHVNINKESNTISLDQSNYIDQLLQRFRMVDCKTVSTPMEAGLSLDKGEDVVCKKIFPYQQLLGSLMYLSVLTRPDISYAVSYLSQFNNCYTETHWKHAKRILKYLKGTRNYGLCFGRTDKSLECYVDADWGSNTFDRKSNTGFCFTFVGGPISWESRKQKTVALSSTEAEYMAMSEASKEAIYLKNLFFELTGVDQCITLFNDNMGAQKLSMNSVFHKRSKHIDVKHHFLRDVVAKKWVQLKYLDTANMPADVLTKSLSSVKHLKFIDKLGIMCISNS